MPQVLAKSNPFAPRKYGELYPVAGGVYILRNITNSSFVVGKRSVAVIDTQVNRPSAEQLLKFIRSVTDKPIEYVINTHYHWDHTNGNQLFKDEGATIISSRLTKEFMADRQDRQKEFLAGRGFELGRDPLLPDVTFEKEHSIDLGDQPLELFFAGRAETDDAIAVHVVRENILMSGDTVMTGSFPIFGQPVWDEGLQDRQWIEAIRRLAAFNPAHVIPGHGPLAHEKELELLIKIEEYFLTEVKTLVERGCDIQRTLAELEPRLPAWITEMPLVWGTPRYAILRVFRGLTKKPQDRETGWQHYKPSAIPKAPEKWMPAKETPQDFLQMASEAKEGGDAALRLAILEKAGKLFSDSPEILTAYAEALIEESRSEASVLEKGDFFRIARQCWDKVLAVHPDHVGALLGKGRYLTMMAYRGGDDPKTGMELLRKVTALKAGSAAEAEAVFYLGMGFRRLGDETKAHFQFQKAIQLNPSFMPAHLAASP